MGSWNLRSLKELIESDYIFKERPIEVVSSIDRAIQIFMYHFFQAKEANDKIAPQTDREALELVLTPTEKFESIYWQKIAVQANVQAAVQTARSVHDIFTQLINCLLLSDSLPIHRCNITKVTNKLAESRLKEHLSGLLESEEYLYVNAMVNTLKHRNVVRFGASVSFDEAGVKFQSFEYIENRYPALWPEQVLERVLAVKNSVVIAGQLLNEEVGV